MEDSHYYRPVDGHGLAHDPFNAIVGPRPIGWISTISDDGVANLAPYSFFNAFNYKPPVIGFSSVGWKDTVRNIQANGEFVYNLATRALAEAMNASSARVDPQVDEFTLAGLACLPCREVRPSRVARSPVALECKATQIIQLQTAKGIPVEAWLTLGEVVGVHIDRHLIVDGSYQTAAAEPILRGGGLADYFAILPDAKFEMRRPG